MGETLLFYAFSGAAIVASAMVIFQRNPMYSVLLLVASFGMISGLYVQLDAPFIAVTQIVVYAGALMVLFLYAVMLLNRPNEDAGDWDAAHPLKEPGMARIGVGLGALLVVQLVYALLRTGRLDEAVGTGGDGGSVRAIGRTMFQDYAFAFEATSVLILVALVGGVYLANREDGR
ncbi:MAG: NADH-quinone oxidoreductase subunit J [Vicinamibacterales bacterium]